VSATFQVRSLVAKDLDAVGVLAGRLVRMHHALDPKRFMRPTDPEAGYRRWFARERKNDDVVLLVAEVEGEVVGYAYAKLEPPSYYALLDAHGALHDVYVDERVRARGIGEALLREVLARLRDKGAPRVVLSTAVQNEQAQRLFTRLGFRPTMLEMTCES
jgi:ribosomal protein S18 acetylase RimI-like enzyme